MTGHKVIAINSWWAGILGTLLTAVVIGSVTYAWNANAQLATLKTDVADIKGANLPIQVASLKVQVDNIVKANERIERSQDKMDDKLDKLLSK